MVEDNISEEARAIMRIGKSKIEIATETTKLPIERVGVAPLRAFSRKDRKHVAEIEKLKANKA